MIFYKCSFSVYEVRRLLGSDWHKLWYMLYRGIWWLSTPDICILKLDWDYINMESLSCAGCISVWVLDLLATLSSYRTSWETLLDLEGPPCCVVDSFNFDIIYLFKLNSMLLYTLGLFGLLSLFLVTHSFISFCPWDCLLSLLSTELFLSTRDCPSMWESSSLLEASLMLKYG